MTRYKINLCFLITLFYFPFLMACGQLQPDEPGSANPSITDTTLEMTFAAEVNTTQYRSLRFVNRSSVVEQITSLAFVNNVCGAFSVFQVRSLSGDILFASGDDLAVTLSPSESVDIILQFSPTPCATSQYSTDFLIYFKRGDAALSELVHLVAIVEDNTVTVVCPEQPQRFFNDGIGDPTPSRKLPVLPNGEKYYLKVTRMRAFIQTTGGFESQKQSVGTDVHLDTMDPNNLFQPVFLPLITNADGSLSLEKIDDCSGFRIPSPESDRYFWGSPIILTTPDVMVGSIEREDPENIGEITFEGFHARLFADINDGRSLAQAEDGKFSVDLSMTLTTGISEPNLYLESIATNEIADDGSPLLPILADGADSILYGTDLYHGQARFVGIGIFQEADTNNLAADAIQALLETEAYLFVMIDVQIVTEKEIP